MANELFDELERRMRENLTTQQRVDLEYAEDMGYEAGYHGPTEKNSHFSIFSAPEFTKAWERGHLRGLKARHDAANGRSE